MSTSLTAYINKLNSNKNTFLLLNDAAHWLECGVTTPAELDKYLAVENYINIYKDINGIKPRWMDFDSMSLAEVEERIALLCDQSESDDIPESAPYHAPTFADLFNT